MVEIKSLRRENVKVYRDEKGKYQMQCYPCRIHYLDTDTQQFEENNGLLKRTARGYKTISAKQRVEFDCQKHSPALIEVVRGKKCIAIESYSTRRGGYVNKDTFSVYHTDRPSLTYENAFENGDIQYICGLDSLKQNVVLKAPPKRYELIFLIKTKDLVMKVVEGGASLAFYTGSHQGNDPLYVLPAPAVTDKNGLKVCFGYYKARRLSKGVYRFSIGLSYPLISEEKYPITITSSLIDGQNLRAVAQHEIPKIGGKKRWLFEPPSTATVLSKKRQFPQGREAYDYGGVKANTIGDYSTIVQRFLLQTQSDMPDYEGYEDPLPKNAEILSSYLPHVLIEYIDSLDYKNQQSVFTFSDNECYRDHIDLLTGHLTVIHTDIAMYGTVLPAQLIRCHRSLRKYEVEEHERYGKGWWLSAQQSIQVADSEKGFHYVYSDGWGKKHYFARNNAEDIIDLEGLSLNFSGFLSYKCQIVNKERCKLAFDENGVLLRVVDACGNYISYTYEDGLLVKINDSHGRSLICSYRDGMLSKVTDSQNRMVEYLYNEKGELASIKFPDERKCEFSYDDFGRIVCITDPFGIQTEYIYSSENDKVVGIRRFTSVHCVSHGQIEQGDRFLVSSVTIEYIDPHTTKVIGEDGICRVYRFDDWGMPIADQHSDVFEEGVCEYMTIFGTDAKIVSRITVKEGAITRTTDLNEQDLPVRITTKDGEGRIASSVYQYDERNKLIAMQDERGIVTKNTYSAKGFLRSYICYHSDVFNEKASLMVPEHYFCKEYFLDKNFEYIAAETDERTPKLFSQYDCDRKSGLLNYVSDKNNCRINFSYDHNSRKITGITCAANNQNRSVSYGYTNGYLTRIHHNGFDYYPIYNALGQQTEIQIGERRISAMLCAGGTRETKIPSQFSHPSEKSVYDKFGRLTETEIITAGDVIINVKYGYLSSEYMTRTVETVSYSIDKVDGFQQIYRYNNNGKLISVSKILANSAKEMVEQEYEYDGFGQLIRENNHAMDYSITYGYDEGGNLLYKRRNSAADSSAGKCADLQEFSYEAQDWKDLLTAFNGERVEYDERGYPTSHRGKSVCFDNSGLLFKHGNNTFAYDSDGYRIRKNNTIFERDKKRLLSETTRGKTIRYIYGITGLIGFEYDEEPYYYQKDLYGNIMSIYDKNGLRVSQYIYDAWGNVKITYDPLGIAESNAFRYKSYYFDVETGLYYIDGRYYDPQVARYISPALKLNPWSICGCNMYIYENNDPVNTAPCCGLSLVNDKCPIDYHVELLHSVQTSPFLTMIPQRKGKAYGDIAGKNQK